MAYSIWVATKSYEGRRKLTERAFDLDAAKARIRNHVCLELPAQWVEAESDAPASRFVLENTDDDVEVEVRQVTVHGDPRTLLDDGE